jgi:lipid-binding SYLF domain-containing protein
MKRYASLILAFSLTTSALMAQSKDSKLIADASAAKAEFIRTDAGLAGIFNSSYGYVIFPNVGKGAIGIGGAAGNGIVYQKGKMVGRASMKQVSVGFQWGGQAYREVIFFDSKDALDRFKASKYEFSAQVSAVAATAGASANVKYRDGVAVFTQQKGGLMYEASIGGQKFKYFGY